ncbi:MAG: RluA family pseudouridine synthase [Pirellulales bacterium]|nr:RluA family pseudouridine synthase [Pirellulales bacterium]
MSSSQQRLDVLYEDNHLLVVNKPAQLPTMGVAVGKPSLLHAAKDYIRTKYNKPGNVYLGVVSRLDAPVTGVVAIARTSKAARRLSAAFRERKVVKTYWAAVEGTPGVPEQVLEHYLRKDERHRRVHVTNPDSAGAQLARLCYRVLSSDQNVTLLQIQLETGRKHQIRVQLAKIGHPVLGDRKYGSRVEFARGIALHARSLQLTHPVGLQVMQVEATVPDDWRRHDPLAHLV